MNILHKHITNRIIMVTILIMVSIISYAQAVDPKPELVSMISHQRQIHKVGMLRLAAVELRKIATDDLNVSVDDLGKIDKAMDKIDKAFGIVDVIVTGGVTSIKIFNTIDDIGSVTNKTQGLLSEYLNMCLKKGDIKKGDTVLVTTCRDMVTIAYWGIQDIIDLIRSPRGLIGLALATEGGIFSCSTDDMLYILEEICNRCDELSANLRNTYFVIWQYMMLRKGYWKELPGPRPPTRELCSNAIERWIRSAGSDKKINY